MRPQLPLTLSEDSEPEPDLAVVRASDAPLEGPHPRSALLVVEVSGDPDPVAGVYRSIAVLAPGETLAARSVVSVTIDVARLFS